MQVFFTWLTDEIQATLVLITTEQFYENFAAHEKNEVFKTTQF